MGDSLTVPGKQVVGLVGMSAKTIPILISYKSIGANLNIDTPFVKCVNLGRCETDFEGLDFKTKEKYIGTSFALLPTILAKLVTESAYYSLAALFTEFMVAMVIFDREKLSVDKSFWIESDTILQFLRVASEDIIQDAFFETTDEEKVDI